MAPKTQVNLRLNSEAAEMARHAAETRHVNVNEYVEQLIRADNEKVYEIFLAGAKEILDDYSELINDIEAAADS
ncbi:hypothetical protein [Streptomyces boncukensis]|uniref:Toxin-antitoxin system HicB family antitoxin n=1 Tax=Streptomyces boncukensis TaxID=2711219 RepID=A0A6G4X0V5_9ACTN|nr:hypothetical protein [Streptomyces boncukensis]NGO70883.1 hypothetical protein [Streptomyces boncukensis]